MDYPSGWTCERTRRSFEYYLLDKLQRLEALALADHLEACPGCVQELVLYRMTLVQHHRG
jgi:hypothetical protein